MRYVKSLLWMIVLFLAFVYPSAAETKYVSDIREITLRNGPGTEYKISGFVSSGSILTVVEVADAWAKVQTNDGKEGWVMSRFLQSEPPISTTLKKLQAALDASVSEKTTLTEQNEQLKTKNKEMETELSGIREKLGRVGMDYETLKKESTELLALQEKLKNTENLLAETQSKISHHEKEYTLLYNDNRVKWFLFGAGVLLLGIAIGYSGSPKRKTSKLR